jgi:hypothetical protein
MKTVLLRSFGVALIGSLIFPLAGNAGFKDKDEAAKIIQSHVRTFLQKKAKEKENYRPLDTLPIEVVQLMSLYLDPASYVRFGCVDQQMNGSFLKDKLSVSQYVENHSKEFDAFISRLVAQLADNDQSTRSKAMSTLESFFKVHQDPDLLKEHLNRRPDLPGRAVIYDDKELMRFLIGADMDIHQQVSIDAPEGATFDAFHRAEFANNLEMLSILVESGKVKREYVQDEADYLDSLKEFNRARGIDKDDQISNLSTFLKEFLTSHPELP